MRKTAGAATLMLLLGLVLTCLVAGPAAAQDEEGEAVLAQVFSGQGADRVGFPGVGLTVLAEDGEELTAETDDMGRALVELPGPGRYTVTLDVETLPEGFVPRGDVTERMANVQAGRTGNALFPLDAVGEDGAPAAPSGGGGGGRSFSDRLGSVPQLVVDGIKLGSIIAITAIGLSLIFGTTGLVNFAHGELVTFGAVMAFFFNAALGGPRVHLIVAALIALVLGGIAGYGLEAGIWAPLRRRGVGLISMLVISIGLSFVVRNVIQIIYGGDTRPYLDYNIQSEIRIGSLGIVPRDLWIIVISLMILVLIGLMLQRTRIGKALRAVADNRDLAASSGINVDRVVRFVWLMGGGLSALGGVLLGATEQVNVNMGFNLLMLMFAGMILGGIGTAYGAMVGALVVGIVSQVSTAFFSTQLKFVWALGILIIVLLIRPQGLLGKAERFG